MIDRREEIKKKRFHNVVENTRNWSDQERAKLKQYFNEGYGITEIALEFGRTERAVQQELYHQVCFPKVRREYRKKQKKNGCLCNQCNLSSEC